MPAPTHWHPVLNRWHDQTGIAHLLHPDGETARPLCGAKLTTATLGGGFTDPRDAGAHPCRNCQRIAATH